MGLNLWDRLQAMKPAGPPKAPRRTAQGPAIETLVSGRLIPTQAGEAFCVETRYSLDFVWGRAPLGLALWAPQKGWRRLLRANAEFDLRRTVFIDTETTGLERGAGTYAFLIGIGRFDEDGFCVRQLLMRDYHEERAVLEALAAELDGAANLITFNGRSFDWPLLETRATLNRMRLPQLLHLDVLHPARRFWRPVTQSCRLAQLEEEILGHRREGDVPGHLIPQRFFDYLETGDGRLLTDVIVHNRLDILTTAALAGYLGTAAAAPLQARPFGEPLPGSDLMAAARILEEEGEMGQSLLCLEEALRRGLPAGLAERCRKWLGTAYKRDGRYDEAVAVWEELAAQGGFSVYPHVELAKHFEHRVKDVEAARRWTLRALELVRQRNRLRGVAGARGSFDFRWTGGDDPELRALQRRLRRLDRKRLAGREGREMNKTADRGA